MGDARGALFIDAVGDVADIERFLEKVLFFAAGFDGGVMAVEPRRGPRAVFEGFSEQMQKPLSHGVVESAFRSVKRVRWQCARPTASFACFLLCAAPIRFANPSA